MILLPSEPAVPELRVERHDAFAGRGRLGMVLIAQRSDRLDIGIARLVCQLGLAQLDTTTQQAARCVSQQMGDDDMVM